MLNPSYMFHWKFIYFWWTKWLSLIFFFFPPPTPNTAKFGPGYVYEKGFKSIKLEDKWKTSFLCFQHFYWELTRSSIVKHWFLLTTWLDIASEYFCWTEDSVDFRHSEQNIFSFFLIHHPSAAGEYHAVSHSCTELPLSTDFILSPKQHSHLLNNQTLFFFSVPLNPPWLLFPHSTISDTQSIHTLIISYHGNWENYDLVLLQPCLSSSIFLPVCVVHVFVSAFWDAHAN